MTGCKLIDFKKKNRQNRGAVLKRTIQPGDAESIEIELEGNFYQANRSLAKNNIAFLDEHRIQAIDILGSIGSGKTTLVQQIVKHLKSEYRIAAIAGDLTTTIDADRIETAGADVIQVNTDGGCHLDARIVRRAMSELDLEKLDLLLVENVGNLICPGGYPVGAHQRMVVVSTTEGPYMIVKHPYILADASVLVVNKIDLAEAMEVDLEQLKTDAIKIKPSLKVVFTNGRTGEGVPDLIDALIEKTS
jgi:hydrogenase nickel incorporation protein HypB